MRGRIAQRFFYERVRPSLETAIASLEGTEEAVAFASGMGAVYAAMLLDARAGNTVVAAPDVYGASYAILTKLLPTLGVETVFVDLLDLDAFESTLKRVKPSLVYAETISNPLLRVANLKSVSDLAHRYGARVAVDNTFASPWLVTPAAHGVDSVIHSTTKYLGGHGDVTGGVIAASTERTAALREINKLIGAVAGPFESWLTLRGIKTLPLRMKQQSDNARDIATWLAQDARVSRVNYPGLQHLGGAEAIFNRPERGGMISFEIAGADKAAVFRFLEALQMVVPATTLGDVYSLVLYPAISSHRAVPPDERARIGISDGLVRLSVGIEAVSDIRSDLDRLGKIEQDGIAVGMKQNFARDCQDQRVTGEMDRLRRSDRDAPEPLCRFPVEQAFAGRGACKDLVEIISESTMSLQIDRIGDDQIAVGRQAIDEARDIILAVCRTRGIDRSSKHCSSPSRTGIGRGGYAART